VIDGDTLVFFGDT